MRNALRVLAVFASLCFAHDAPAQGQQCGLVDCQVRLLPPMQASYPNESLSCKPFTNAGVATFAVANASGGRVSGFATPCVATVCTAGKVVGTGQHQTANPLYTGDQGCTAGCTVVFVAVGGASGICVGEPQQCFTNGTSTETGEKCTGGGFGEPIGQQGPKGDKGDKGDKGEQGDQGQEGEKGEEGEKGDKGDNACEGENANAWYCEEPGALAGAGGFGGAPSGGPGLALSAPPGPPGGFTSPGSVVAQTVVAPTPIVPPAVGIPGGSGLQLPTVVASDIFPPDPRTFAGMWSDLSTQLQATPGVGFPEQFFAVDLSGGCPALPIPEHEVWEMLDSGMLCQAMMGGTRGAGGAGTILEIMGAIGYVLLSMATIRAVLLALA